MDIDDTGFWTMSGTLLIEITNPDDNPNNWIKNYYDFNTKPWVGDSFQRQFHSAIFLKDPYIFFKGFSLENGIKKATLSRISMEKFKNLKAVNILNISLNLMAKINGVLLIVNLSIFMSLEIQNRVYNICKILGSMFQLHIVH